MNKRIRVIQYGLGAMGSVMAKMILGKKDLELVGAVVNHAEDANKDVATVIGLKKKTGIKTVLNDEKWFKTLKADVVLQATVSYVPKVWEQIAPAVKAGLNVVTIAEEMGYPFKKYPKLCKTIDREAKKHGVTVLGTGINPGFAMDVLPLLISGICHDVKSIKVTRLVDFSPFGPAIQHNIGIGMKPKAFKEAVKQNKLPLHIGLPESAHQMAKGLGWKLDKIKETREPIIAQHALKIPGYKTVLKGEVCGFNHRCFAYEKGKLRILLEELGNVDPNLEYKNTIKIDGTPSIVETMNVPMGNLTTTSHAVNVLPYVAKAPSGLLSMMDLPVVPCLPIR